MSASIIRFLGCLFLCGIFSTPAGSAQVEITESGALWTDVIDVEARGAYAFCSLRYGFVVLDISSRSTPAVVAQIPLPEQIGEIALEGNFAYVLNGDFGISVIDITVPTSPAVSNYYDTRTFGAIAATENYLLITDGGFDLQIINVADPRAPFLEGSFRLSMPGYDICIDDTLAYVGESHYFEVLDISNPRSPRKVGGMQTNVEGINVSGDRFLACLMTTTTENSVLFISIDDNGSPSLLNSYSPTEHLVDVKIEDSTAYVILENPYNDLDSGLVILDLSAPPAVTITSSFKTFSNCSAISLQDSLAIVCEGMTGIEFIDISDNTEPSLLGAYMAMENWSHTIVGYRAYLAGIGFGIADISNPGSPRIIGRTRLPDFYGRSAVVKNQIGYLSGHRLSGTSNSLLYILDIYDETAPTLRDSVILPASHGYDLELVGEYLFVSPLAVYDISDPLHPIPAATYPAGFSSYIELADNLCILNLPNDSTGVVDISAPTFPVLRGSFFAPFISDAAISADRAYLARGDWLAATGALSIVSIDDPEHPRLSGNLDFPWRMLLSISLHQNWAACGVYSYILGNPDGLYFVDISNPDSPESVAVYEMPGIIWDVTLAPTTISVSSRFGFHILNWTIGCCNRAGDFNTDDVVNILDITSILGYLFKGGAPADCFQEADADNNGKINILDATRLVCFLYKSCPAPVCP